MCFITLIINLNMNKISNRTRTVYVKPVRYVIVLIILIYIYSEYL